jgi:hypothetical protein
LTPELRELLKVGIYANINKSMQFFRNLFKRGKDVGMVGDLVPSPLDDRDYPLSGVMPEIKRYPESYPRPFDLTIFNQRSIPCCVGCAGATIKQFLEMKERVFIIPDYEWLYKECKKIDGIPHIRGTYFRAVLAVLKNTGCKLLGQNNDPSIYRIAQYRKVDNMTFENIKKIIAVYGHILSGWTGSNAGWRGEIIRPPTQYEQTWGHATVSTHYEKSYGGGQNSWGKDRHKDGLFKYPSTYLPFEGWVVFMDTPNVPKEEEKKGWVASMYVLNNTTTANLNVRLTPGLGGDKIDTLPKGTVVKFTGTPMQWVDRYWWKEIVLPS